MLLNEDILDIEKPDSIFLLTIFVDILSITHTRPE